MSGTHGIMHFTHIGNLPGILAAGCLQADNLVDRSSALKVEAADLDVKAARQWRPLVLPSCSVTETAPLP